ncbi:MAG: copper resistance CopC/CopD family protein [Candidatus Dormibacteria bacterium]
MPLTASAHALPQRAIPPEGAEVQAAPASVTIIFGETPDPRLSTISVVNGSGLSVDDGPTTAVPGNPLELEVPLQHIGTGVYTVTWKTVSEVDGHLATGAYAFGVGVSATSANAHAARSVVSPAPSILAVVSRWLFFIGSMGIVGMASTCLVALREIPRFAARGVLAMWIAASLGVAGVVESEREAAAIGWSALFSTSLGTVVVERLAALMLIAAGIVAAFLHRATARRIGIGLAGLGAAAAMWVDVAASHAGAQAPVAANLLAQWAHIVATGVWIGGLLALILAVRGQPSEMKGRAVRRFSTAAGVAIVVVAVTGTFRAVIEIGSVSSLFSTTFGVLVLAKVALFVVLAGLGAINRFGNVPRTSGALRGLRRIASTEIVVGTAVMLIAATLVNVAPPVASAAPVTTAQAAQLVVSGSDFATTVRVRLSVSPGSPGFNEFTLRVTDYDTGATVQARSVQLEFSQPLRPQLGQSTLTLTHRADGSFAGRGANLAVAGIWEVAAIVDDGGRSTEVHMQVTTISPAPTVTATRFNGLPTLYSVQLQNGWLAQVYIDPDKPGADEFHVTFFTNSNETSEIQIATATIGMTPPGGMPTILVSRRLDPIGHFVADAMVPAGATRYDIIATTQTGVAIATYVTITPG